MNPISLIHGRYVHLRRVDVLGERMGSLLPDNAVVLDVGCGDGRLAQAIQSRRAGVSVVGIDVHVRAGTAVPVTGFDGAHIPYPDRSFDAVIFADVLHHTEDPMVLLREAARTTRRYVLIKDHVLQGVMARQTLRLMDEVANRRHGIALPFNYWTRAQWDAAFAAAGMAVDEWVGTLGLYPWPARLWFERSLHFVARLRARAKT